MDSRNKLKSKIFYERPSYLVGKISDKVIFMGSDKKKINCNIHGEIIFLCYLSKREPKFLIDSFNLISDSVKTKYGETGQISFQIDKTKQVSNYNHKRRTFTSSFNVNMHCRLIDKKKKWKKDEFDNFKPYMETFRATINCKFAKPLKPELNKFEVLKFEIKLKCIKSVIRIFFWCEFKCFIYCWWWYYFCRDGTLSKPERRLCIQPVFIRSGPSDTSPTGTSFNTGLDNANKIWEKCCIQFVAKDPIYVNDTSYKSLTTAEENNLLDEVNEDDCIEVFVVDTWDPEDTHGGGATWSGGTESAKIISADNNLPLNQNHLAHELGHALNLKHPGAGTATRPGGCPNTIMEPSGFYADNPEEQCEENCNNASNPLLTTHYRRCCISPEL